MELLLSREALTGRSRAGLRISLSILSALVLVVFAANVPPYISELGAVCAKPGCNPDQLTAESARTLDELGFSTNEYAAYFGGITIASALVWFGVAAVIGWRGREDPFSLFVALTLVLVGAFPVTGSVESSFLPLATRAVNGMELFCFMLFLCLFPDGRFTPRWTVWISLGAALLGALSVLFPNNPLGPLWFVFAGVLIGAQIHRYRRVSDSTQRRQTRWVVFAVAAVVLTVLGMFLATRVFPSPGAAMSFLLAPLASIVLLLIPLSIGVSILRHRLFDIDLVVNRTLVYGTLTACVVGVYVLIVGYLGALFRVEDNLLVSLAAAGVVAVIFAPLRDRLQKTMNRIMYGERHDPYAVISRLGERMEATLAPDEILPTVARTVREALKLPYAAISLRDEDGLSIAAEDGEPSKNIVRLPLPHHGEEVGEMSLAPRPGEDGFSPADMRLLEDLARQAGATVHAVRLTRDLQSSRERLVSTREEERRRLRRDLHDGLGPTLGSLPMKLDVASDMISSDPEAATDLLHSHKTQTRSATSDVRRLVHELRPPALDELGLAGAIREVAARQNGLRIEVEAPENLPPLPAAAEVAAYRIAGEAMANAASHASASICEVRIAVGEDGLTVEVSDDGRGIGKRKGSGVGLHSMRERAEELGGSFEVESSPENGTRVRASLPLGGSEK